MSTLARTLGKIFLILVLNVVPLLPVPTVAAQTRAVTILINSSPVLFHDQQPYLSKNNRIMVPVRPLAEALGAQIDWDAKTKHISVKYRCNTMDFIIGSKKISVNDKTLLMDSFPVIKNQRAMVPLRFLCEALGAKISWIQETHTVDILYSSLPEDKFEAKVLIDVNRNMEQQLKDLHLLLSNKFDITIAEGITEYLARKTKAAEELPLARWKSQSQLLDVVSKPGENLITLTLWQPYT